MAHVLRQPTHTCEIVTREGEVKILLEINLNINTNSIQVAADVLPSSPLVAAEEDVQWAIPSFKSDNKIKFGKKVEE